MGIGAASGRTRKSSRLASREKSPVSGAASSTKRTPPSAKNRLRWAISESVKGASGPSPRKYAKGSDQSASSSARTGEGLSLAGALVRLMSSCDQREGAVARTPENVERPVKSGRGLKAPSSPNAIARRGAARADPSASAVPPRNALREMARFNRSPPLSTRPPRAGASRSGLPGSAPRPRRRTPARRACRGARGRRRASADRSRRRFASRGTRRA